MRAWQILILTALALWARVGWGMYEDQAGEWDWKIEHVGEVQGTIYQGKFLFAWSERGVIAALNVRTGVTEWRFILPKGEDIDSVLLSGSSLLVLSGQGKFVRSIRESDGVLLWDNVAVTYNGEESNASGTRVLGVVAKDGENFCVLAQGSLLFFRVSSGLLSWQWFPDSDEIQQLEQIQQNGQSLVLTDLSISGSNFVAAGCVVSSADPVMKEVCLQAVLLTVDSAIESVKVAFFPYESIETPVLLNTVKVASIGSGLSSLRIFGASPDSGMVVITDPGTQTMSTVQVPAGVMETAVSGRAGQDQSVLINVRANGGCKLFKVSETSSDLITDCGGQLCDGITMPTRSQAYFTAFAASSTGIKLWIIQAGGSVAMAVEGTLTARDGRVVRVFPSVFQKKEGGTAYRALVVTSTLSHVMFQSGGIVWRREEALAAVTQVAFVERISSSMLEVMHMEAHTHQIPTLVERLELQTFLLQQWYHGLVAGLSYLIETLKELKLEPTRSRKTVRQASKFGFNKLAVCMTASLNMVAVDMITGAIEWASDLSKYGSTAYTHKLLELRSKSTLGYLPQVLTIFIGEDQITMVTVNAIEGKIEGMFAIQVPPGHEFSHIVHLGHSATYQSEVYGICLTDGQVVGFPSVSDVPLVHADKPVFVSYFDQASGLFSAYPLRSYNEFNTSETLTVSLASPVCSTSFEGGKVLSVAAPRREDVIQSTAQALGDDSVLLKYINPHMLAVASEEALGGGMYITVLDTVSCRVLYRTHHNSARAPVRMTIIENWLVYSYWNTKAHRTELGVITLFEGMLGRFDLNPFKHVDISPRFSSWVSPPPIGLQKTFAFPRNIVSLTSTLTAQGITTKHVLVGLETGQVLSLPLRVIDPRRPEGEPTAHQKTEGLPQYTPYLHVSAPMVINYFKAVPRLSGVFSTPAKLESTSLVLITGLDLFATRVTPSKTFDMLASDFNHVLLVGILVSMALGLVVLHKLAKDKRISTTWM